MALEGLLEDRFEGLLTGKTKARELPEFQSMRKMLESAGAKSRAGTARQMRQMGISGPSVGMTMQQQEEKQLAPMGGAMGSLLSSIMPQAASWGQGQRGMDIQEKLGMGQLFEARKARKAATPSDFEKGMGMAGCVLTTACYGSESIEVQAMRKLRDILGGHPVIKKIIRGYYIFSDMVLPLMEKECVNKAVKKGLIDPLLRMIMRKFGISVRPWMTPVDRGISFLALSLWRLMGSRGTYTRRNGEKV